MLCHWKHTECPLADVCVPLLIRQHSACVLNTILTQMCLGGRFDDCKSIIGNIILLVAWKGNEMPCEVSRGWGGVSLTMLRFGRSGSLQTSCFGKDVYPRREKGSKARGLHLKAMYSDVSNHSQRNAITVG